MLLAGSFSENLARVLVCNLISGSRILGARRCVSVVEYLEEGFCEGYTVMTTEHVRTIHYHHS